MVLQLFSDPMSFTFLGSSFDPRVPQCRTSLRVRPEFRHDLLRLPTIDHLFLGICPRLDGPGVARGFHSISR